jgi:signal transduction histidine kinase/CheY-like chemotaxis protein/HPt (histidine-containing phosphotransfer) domain-containing protein
MSKCPQAVEARASALFREQYDGILRRTDRLFSGLMLFQWLMGIVAAFIISPWAWSGSTSGVHVHLYAAVLLGGAISSLPVYLAMVAPGRALTRHTIAVGQALSSALLIHLLGGRIETHFHVFGSLALLAFYRDWRVLVSFSAVVALDHLVRGIVWPESVYGVASASPWRWLEHAGWVVFEDMFLFWSCRQGISEMRDVSHRQALLEATTVQAQRAQDAAEGASRTKSQFLANMSHEIRTPLNAILGFADILHKAGRDMEPTERDDYLETIHSSGRHLLTLINDILDLSKIEAGMLDVERVPCSPHQVVAQVVSVLRVRAEEKGIALEYNWSGGIPEIITTDPARLRQLLMNLVGNAIKFTPTGAVEISGRLVEEDGRKLLRFDVSDTGIGIAPDKLESIFDPFVQADSSVTRQFGGTGLGLPISRRLTALLGGRLEVTSELGVGSVFTFWIDPGPLADTPATRTAPPQIDGEAIVPGEAPRLPALRILLVDDGATNRKLINLMLRRAGADVVTAENGRVAVERAMAEHFDLVLMDMQMPVMDGYTAARTLRDRGLALPIIALTAHAMKGDEDACRAAGCSGYLAKPIDYDGLIRAVAGAVRASQPPRAIPAAADPLVSSLPMDDPDFREIVEEFVQTLRLQMKDMRAAAASRNVDRLAALAHWLKGAGGTAGFAAFTAPAASLERVARHAEYELVGPLLDDLEQLVGRIAIASEQPA